VAMLQCALAALMVEVIHDFIAFKKVNAKIAARLNDGWEMIFCTPVTASPGSQNREAQLLCIFKKGSP